MWLAFVEWLVMAVAFAAAILNYRLNDGWWWTWDEQLYWYRRYRWEERRTLSDGY